MNLLVESLALFIALFAKPRPAECSLAFAPEASIILKNLMTSTLSSLHFVIVAPEVEAWTFSLELWDYRFIISFIRRCFFSFAESTV